MLLRWCKFFVVAGILLIVIAAMVLFAWIWQPFDKSAWRVKLPVASGIEVRVVPVLMMVTSAPGRWLLDHRAFSMHHGDIRLFDAQGLRVQCHQCWILAKSVSNQPLMIPEIELWLQRNQQDIRGYLQVTQTVNHYTINFQGKVSMRSVRLEWQLPPTPLAQLLQPLRQHSQVINQAKVTGTIHANGTLYWPHQIWSAVPNIQGLVVDGLDISLATTLPLKYDCPLLDENKFPEKMQWVPYEKMGRWLPMATIIAEDAEFRHHAGYEIAKMQHLLGQKSADKKVGGSTITQQLAKYLFTNGERTWKRKIEELLYAVTLESQLDKTQILTLYLNTVDLGPGLCGVHAASAYYFNQAPTKLNPIQAAWLAGIIANPHRAWKQQYMLQKPDITRAEHILRYMPEVARTQSGTLNFRVPTIK